jgi:hypothetical protein
MKYILFFALALSNSSYLMAMQDAEQTQEEELTPLERSYFAWFEKLSQDAPSIFQSLSKADREIFSRKRRYSQCPEDAIRRARTNYAHAVYAYARGNGTPICDEATLTSVVLRATKLLYAPPAKDPTDLSSVRAYVYNQLLSPQEKNAWAPDEYLKNPHKAEAIAARFSTLLVDELAKLGLVENNEVAKTEKSIAFCNAKIAELKKACGKTK